jgi:predicted dehydrogenase
MAKIELPSSKLEMEKTRHHSITRREFIDSAAKMAIAASTAPLGLAAANAAVASSRKRIALVGTGSRGTEMWGKGLEQDYGVEMVGLCDINPLRLEASKKLMGVAAQTYTDFDRMIRETKPDTVIVTTKDATHDHFIIRALEMDCNVITEKPMTTDEHKCQKILDAEKAAGRKIVVGFNYRYAGVSEKIKEILMTDPIGPLTSIDFHWYLDTRHGADYFRRWHAYKENSGSLFVHKATHHFDLINWAIDAEPVEVSAQGDLKVYGRSGKFRSTKCRGCPHKPECKFYYDIMQDPEYVKLYVNAESADGYFRDACVFRDDINIYDSMTAQVKYNNGVLMSYSLNAYLPMEGFHLAFNGQSGRIEVRNYERQPWQAPAQAEIRISKMFEPTSEIVLVNGSTDGHFGADPKLKNMIFHESVGDPLHQRAGSRAGAMSLLIGVAAVRSIEREQQPIRISDLVQI